MPSEGVRPVTGFWSRLLDVVSPRMCLACGGRLSVTEEAICSRCNLHLPRTGFPQHPADNTLARLFWGHIPVERAAALFYYEAGSETANIVYTLKYKNHPEVGETLGRMMGRELAVSGFFEGIDGIVPIPLTRRRQRQRGYNQSLEMGRGIREVTGLPLFDGVVRRTAFTESQTKKHLWERRENVEHVFSLTHPEAVRGKHLLLLDDVVTTGATMTACARQLLQAEGVRVSILALGFAKTV